MKTTAFPFCCTAKVVCDFGGTAVSEGENGLISEAELIADLNKKISAQGQFLLVATTNSDQVLAARALRKCGFKSTVWMSKLQHHETKIKLWWRAPSKIKIVNNY